MGSGEDPTAEKARLRAEFRARRAAMDEAAWAGASAAIVGRLLALPEVAGARTAHVFWPMAARREVDTRLLIEALDAKGVRVALPVVASAPGEAPRLVQRRYAAGALAPGRFGVEEPQGTEGVAPEALDVAIVPALAADRAGARLGYGGGFYDAFLAGFAGPVVCPVFAFAFVGALPREPHDRRVDVVVTEHEVARIGRGEDEAGSAPATGRAGAP
jgi:5-formyltetrahydrofolate cyclo-ligase